MMTGFLDLPFEVRELVYKNVLATIIEGRKRIFWVPDVLEQDIEYQALAITYRRARDFRQQENGLCVVFRYDCPTVNHRDIVSLIFLAQTCHSLYNEVLKFAWKAVDFQVQGTLDMICGLLRPHLALHMSVAAKDSITSLELIINKPRRVDGLEYMKEIVGMINTHLPVLEVLTLSFPHVTLHVPGNRLAMLPLCRPAKALLAQLLSLRLRLLIDFQAHYHIMRYNYSHYHSNYNARILSCTELVARLRSEHATNRAKATDRQRKTVESNCLDPDYYIHKTLGLRSSTYYEEIRCCFDHKVQNHLRKIYLPGLRMTSRCATPEPEVCCLS